MARKAVEVALDIVQVPGIRLAHGCLRTDLVTPTHFDAWRTPRRMGYHQADTEVLS